VEGWDRSTWSCCMLAVTDFEGCSNTAQLIAQNNVKSWKCGRMRQFLEKLLGTMTFENFFRQIFGEIGLAVLKCRICDDALAMLQLFNQECADCGHTRWLPAPMVVHEPAKLESQHQPHCTIGRRSHYLVKVITRSSDLFLGT
jgi:hypothetical protein